MYRLSILSKNLIIEDVKSSHLGTILEWYNNPEYFYATGNEINITMCELWEKYQEFMTNPNMFFSMIYRKSDKEPLGFLKGSIIKEKNNSIWIAILLILSPFQRLGYGTETFYAFLEKCKGDESLENLYLTCLERNVKGGEFWKKMGFESSSKLPPKQLEKKNVKDIVIMEKVI